MIYPDSLSKIISNFKSLPGIGEKTAERLAFSVLELDETKVRDFSKNLINLQEKIGRCERCNFLSETKICGICSDKTRDESLVCVVEDSKKVFLFEKIGSFNGVYHVLDGLISPLDGVNPEDIELKSLITKIERGKIKEVILAIKPGIEGETTSLYISRLLSGVDIKITKIAHGIPIGADMEYIDSLTLERALEDRKSLI